MTSEHDYRNAVRYLQNLLNGGLMGARGTSPLMTAICLLYTSDAADE